jgi:hypothetical protein
MVQDERIGLAIVAANNHYTGFGPGTANVLRNMLREKQQEEKYPQHDLEVKQRTLSEFRIVANLNDTIFMNNTL